MSEQINCDFLRADYLSWDDKKLRNSWEETGQEVRVSWEETGQEVRVRWLLAKVTLSCPLVDVRLKASVKAALCFVRKRRINGRNLTTFCMLIQYEDELINFQLNLNLYLKIGLKNGCKLRNESTESYELGGASTVF